MAYDTDEEQIEALRHWWKENGSSVIIGVVVVVAVLIGSRYWQSSQTEKAENASELYQQMTAYVDPTGQSDVAEEGLAAMQALNRELREEFDGTIYSHYASLLMARLHVEAGNLDAAEAELRWILDNPKIGLFKSIGDELSLTARARLARVQLANGEPEQALNTLDAVEAGTFEGVFAEIRGDAYLELGRVDEARSAYQRALNLGVGAAVVQLKLNDLDS